MMGMGLAHARRDRQANRKMVKTGNEMNFGAMVIGRGFGCLRMKNECTGEVVGEIRATEYTEQESGAQ